MAERRMMAKSVIKTDKFMDMPATAKVLYFYLMLAADDDGFVANPKSIMRQINAGEDDMKILLAKGYVLIFESGVIVIVHWKIHNYIQKDRYRKTVCEEKKYIKVNSNKAYELIDLDSVSNMDTSRIQDGYNMDTPCIQSGYVGKDRIGKDRIGKGSSSSDENDDDEHLKMIRFYEENFSTVSGYISELLDSLKEDYSYEWVMQAMKACARAGRQKCNARYLEGVLKGWKADGISKPWEQSNKAESEAKKKFEEEKKAYRREVKWY